MSRTYYGSSAQISDCERFRYSLVRVLEPLDLKRVLWIMLNPSTAHASKDDPTIRKVVGFTERMGGTSFRVENLYAYRTKSPKVLKLNGYIVGPENDEHILQACDEIETVVCAWGAAAQPERAKRVLKLIQESGRTAYALGLTQNGQPLHPLMAAYSNLPLREVE